MIDRYKFMSRLFFITLWVVLCWGFLATDVFTPLDKVRSAVNLLADAIFIIMSLSVLNTRHDKIVIISFLIISLVSAYINHSTKLAYFNGFRDFAGLLFAAPLLRYFIESRNGERFERSFDRQLYAFLWLQVFCIATQFVRFGAGDHGGGSLGNGGSGTISTLIYVISFYLMNKNWDEEKSYLENLLDNKIYVFLLFPTFLNETKISFVLLLFYFVLLMKIDRQMVIRLAFATPLLVVFMIVGGFLYLKATDTDIDMYDADFFNEYIFGDDIEHLIELSQAIQEEDLETDNLWTVDLPRLGRFIAVPEALSHTKGGYLLGGGIGLFKGGRVVEVTGFARDYAWLLAGSPILLFFIFMQLGAAGTVWNVWAVCSTVMDGKAGHRDVNIRFYLLMTFALIFVYAPFFRAFNFCLIFYYLALAKVSRPAGSPRGSDSVRTLPR